MTGNNLNARPISVLGLIAAGCSLASPINVEIVPEQEPAWRAEIAAITVELQTRRQSLQNGDTFRGVHPKSQGCVKASFIVNSDIDAEYRVGLFKNPGKKYTADIRYSNAAVRILPDLDKGINGSRGMAIKVYGVDGNVLFTDDGKRNQDFLMINTPELAFGNVRDYLRISRALKESPNASTPYLFFCL